MSMVLKRTEAEKYDKYTSFIAYSNYFSQFIGDWFGIEWDEKRGKHNGTHEGILYFNCRYCNGCEREFTNYCI